MIRGGVSYKVFTVTLAAGASSQIIRDADFLTCLDGGGATFQIGFDGQAALDFEGGLTIRPTGGLRRVEVTNPTGASITVKLGLGKGDIRDARLTVGSATLNVAEDMPDTLTSGAAVSAATGATTSIAAVNTARREAVLRNQGAGDIYIGGASGALAGQGLLLKANETLTLQTTAAIYARNDSGAAVSVGVLELERT